MLKLTGTSSGLPYAIKGEIPAYVLEITLWAPTSFQIYSLDQLLATAV